MTSVFEIIINGIGTTVGWEIITALLLIFSFVLLGMSRGLGFASLASTLMLGAYLFTENQINARFLIAEPTFLLFVIIFGLLLGWIFYIVVLKD